jgi:phospholipase C
VSLSRRQLLLGTAAGMAVGGAVGEAAAATRPARVDALPAPKASGIDHIVVVVMENRSFDHMLGWVRGADGRQAGLHYRDDHGHRHATHRLTTSHGCGYSDPGHSHTSGLVQLNHGRCDGFRRRGNDDLAIGYYTRDDVPFYGPLVDQATVFDRWFAAVLGPTVPNRNYSHAGRTDRMGNEQHVATMPTLWDRLAAAGVPATYYFNDSPYLALWGDRYVSTAKRFDQFLVEAASGTLPQFSYIDPAFDAGSPFGSNDDHPHCDIRRGQSFLATIAQALVHSPLWSRTALFITYDEWGGFFDHVRPPLRADEGPLRGVDRRQTGFRVPAFVLSPYARRGGVNHGVYDHAALVKFVSWRFGLQSLAPRDQSANNLAWAFDFRRPDFSIPSLPVVPDPGPHSCDPLPAGVGDEEMPFWMMLNEHAQRGGWRHV